MIYAVAELVPVGLHIFHGVEAHICMPHPVCEALGRISGVVWFYGNRGIAPVWLDRGAVGFCELSVRIGFPPFNVVTECLAAQLGEVDIPEFGNPVGVGAKFRILRVHVLEIPVRQILFAPTSEQHIADILALHLPLYLQQSALEAVLKNMAHLLSRIAYLDCVMTCISVRHYAPPLAEQLINLYKYIPDVGVAYFHRHRFFSIFSVGIQVDGYAVAIVVFKH